MHTPQIYRGNAKIDTKATEVEILVTKVFKNKTNYELN